MKRQKTYFLESLGINHGQEEALIMLCNELWQYQLDNPFIYFDNNCEMCITHPFYEDSGRFWSNPIEEYGDNFINSEFVEIAKSFQLTNTSTDKDIVLAVKAKLEELFAQLIKNKLSSNKILSDDFVDTMSLELYKMISEFVDSLTPSYLLELNKEYIIKSIL